MEIIQRTDCLTNQSIIHQSPIITIIIPINHHHDNQHDQQQHQHCEHDHDHNDDNVDDGDYVNHEQ